jgi:type IV pilus assembly protein PilY1
LSAPSAIDTDGDGIADVIYAGDLNGNLWKFDLSGTTVASWGLGNASAPMFTAAANQPIIGQPNVIRVPRGGYIVTFGTGQYMATGDNGNTAAQAIYGIWDNLSNGTVTLAQLQQQSIAGTTTVAGNTFRVSTHSVDPAADALVTGDNAISRADYYATKRGWYLNLPTAGERVVVDALIRSGRVIYTSLIPDTSDPCVFGGLGWVLEFDAITGNRFDAGTFDTNRDGIIDAADRVVQGVGRVVASGVSVGSIPAAAAPMERGRRPTDTPGSCVEIKYVNTSEGTVKTYAEACGKGGSARVMWREVQ